MEMRQGQNFAVVQAVVLVVQQIASKLVGLNLSYLSSRDSFFFKLILVLTLLAINGSCINKTEILYDSFKGERLHLDLINGKNVSFALLENPIPTSDLTKLILKIDSAYDYAKVITGFEPKVKSNFLSDKLIYAQVSNTCGVGCGYLGMKGVEIEKEYFNGILLNFHTDKEIDPLFFYEMGRNFFPYSNKLELKINKETHIISTGVAIYIQCKLANNSMGKISKVNSTPFKYYYKSLVSLADSARGVDKIFIQDALLSNQNVPQLNNWSVADIIASILIEMEQGESRDSFLVNFYTACRNFKDSSSVQNSLDNFVLACSLATKKNQINYFIEIGWPISPTTIDQLNKTFHL